MSDSVIEKRVLGKQTIVIKKTPTDRVLAVCNMSLEEIGSIEIGVMVILQSKITEVMENKKQIAMAELRKQQEVLLSDLRKQQEELNLKMAAITGVTPTNALVIQRGPRSQVHKPKANVTTGKIETEEETAKRLKKNAYSTNRKNDPKVAKMVKYNAARSAAKKLDDNEVLLAKWNIDWPKGGSKS